MDRRYTDLVAQFIDRLILPEIKRNEALHNTCQALVSTLSQSTLTYTNLESFISSAMASANLKSESKGVLNFAKKEKESPS